ncbi:MAG: hypothetical protein AAF937_01665 [Planctomycetota bacterium]
MTEPHLEFHPRAAAWRTRDFTTLDHDDLADRERLGLPTDRPVVMLGHQPGFWHPGIVAKLFAASAAADKHGATLAWLVIDTDDTDPAEIRIPVLGEDGGLRVNAWSFGGGRSSVPAPSATRDPIDPVSPDGLRHALECAEHRLHAAVKALRSHRHARSIAAQFTRAAIGLLGLHAPLLVFASDLPDTNAYQRAVDAMRRSPSDVASRYNKAVHAFPDAGVSQLRVGDDAELPLWRVSSGGTRLPMRASQLGSAKSWPRALLTSGIARASLCDLFVHGSGGKAYEPINDGWLPETLHATLAPFTAATATIVPRFPGRGISAREAARALWRAQHAEHHPGVVGDTDAERARESLVREIEHLPRDSVERAEAFGALHDLIADHRRRNSPSLGTLAEAAAVAKQAAAEQPLRNDRTWSFLMHDADAIRDLAAMVASRTNE